MKESNAIPHPTRARFVIWFRGDKGVIETYLEDIETRFGPRIAEACSSMDVGKFRALEDCYVFRTQDHA